MKLVRFSNGTYGIRRFSWLWFGWAYLDFRHTHNLWWPKGSKYFRDCQTDEKTARDFFPKDEVIS